MWHAGRQAHPANTGGIIPIAPSALRSLEHAAIRDENGNITEAELVVPRALELSEIPGIVEQFRRSAVLAKEAGFDGVELHGVNGHPSSSCWMGRAIAPTRMAVRSNTARDSCSRRSMPSSQCGAPDRVALRLSPSGTYGTMSDSDAHATFGYVAERLNGYGLAYRSTAAMDAAIRTTPLIPRSWLRNRPSTWHRPKRAYAPFWPTATMHELL